MTHARDSSTPGKSAPPEAPPALERMARWATRTAGGDYAFAVALVVVLLALVGGPFLAKDWLFRLSAGAGLVSFLLLFLLQRSQNIEARATQLKLNEIVAALEGASNRLIAVEHRSEQELATLTGHYDEISGTVAEDPVPTRSVSVEAAVQGSQADSAT